MDFSLATTVQGYIEEASRFEENAAGHLLKRRTR